MVDADYVRDRRCLRLPHAGARAHHGDLRRATGRRTVGALAATLGAFLAPWALSATAAQQVTRLAQNRWLRAFGAGAGPAVIGILGATVLDIARDALVSWPYVAVSAAVFVLTARTRTHPSRCSLRVLCLAGLSLHSGGK